MPLIAIYRGVPHFQKQRNISTALVRQCFPVNHTDSVLKESGKGGGGNAKLRGGRGHTPAPPTGPDQAVRGDAEGGRERDGGREGGGEGGRKGGS